MKSSTLMKSSRLMNNKKKTNKKAMVRAKMKNIFSSARKYPILPTLSRISFQAAGLD